MQSFTDLLVLDGGLATELEFIGHDLSDALWSARLLLDDPKAIQDIHYDYLLAGADIITTATYQATIDGMLKQGLQLAVAIEVLRSAVTLAVSARKAFWRFSENRKNRIFPLVAASIGPYGAYLANGAEYTGNYGIHASALRRFHKDRWWWLHNTEADFLLCETIPSFLETKILANLAQASTKPVIISLQCKDDAHIADGTPITECAQLLDTTPQIQAIGVNCIHPDLVAPLLKRLNTVTDKPKIAYANSGETWNAETKSWERAPSCNPAAYADLAQQWYALGARIIGGCCRTTPEHIAEIRKKISN